MIEKTKRWQCKGYLNWVATLPCSNCGLDDNTTVAHHLKHRWSPWSGGGTSMKANDHLVMPLCFACHNRAHNGDSEILDFQPHFIFKALDKAFRDGGVICFQLKMRNRL